jgi:hypothetical protein
MTMLDSRRTSVFPGARWGDAPVAHRMDRDAERSDQAMNAYAIFMVNEHLQVLLDEAATRRQLKVEKPGLRQRIASAASSVKATFESPADYSNSIIPNLQDYPYRS